MCGVNGTSTMTGEVLAVAGLEKETKDEMARDKTD
jgi:hypothetical protein